ncbi:MAG TPA: hypothetical protein VIU93_06590 [Gallionellaceae bacterium]
MHPAVTALRTQLEQAGRDYFCDTSLPAPLAAVRFIGPFQGEDVVWQLNLTTLAQARRHAPAPCPFIEIAAGEAGVHAITVGLELPHIDEPAIRKASSWCANTNALPSAAWNSARAAPASELLVFPCRPVIFLRQKSCLLFSDAP